MNVVIVTQALLAATSGPAANAGAAFVLYILLIAVTAAWPWAIYNLIAGTLHCFFGYRLLIPCVVLEGIFCGGAVGLLSGVLASSSPPWMLARFVIGAIIAVAVLVSFYVFVPVLLGGLWSIGLVMAALRVVGLGPSLLFVLPAGILGGWVVWKRKRDAYIFLFAVTGAGLIVWSVVTLVHCWVFEGYRLIEMATVETANGARTLGRHTVGPLMRVWNATMGAVLAGLGVWVQYRQLDAWELGTGAKTEPSDEETPNVFPGVDTGTHVGYGYKGPLTEKPDGPDELHARFEAMVERLQTATTEPAAGG